MDQLKKNTLFIGLMVLSFGVSCETKENGNGFGARELMVYKLLENTFQYEGYSLPEPEINTALMQINENNTSTINYQLKKLLACKTGLSGITYHKADGEMPSLDIHSIDMAKTAGVYLQASNPPTTGSHLDLSLGIGKNYGLINDCNAKVYTTTESVYELGVANCLIADNFGKGSHQIKLSFRLKCNKE